MLILALMGRCPVLYHFCLSGKITKRITNLKKEKFKWQNIV